MRSATPLSCDKYKSQSRLSVISRNVSLTSHCSLCIVHNQFFPCKRKTCKVESACNASDSKVLPHWEAWSPLGTSPKPPEGRRTSPAPWPAQLARAGQLQAHCSELKSSMRFCRAQLQTNTARPSLHQSHCWLHIVKAPPVSPSFASLCLRTFHGSISEPHRVSERELSTPTPGAHHAALCSTGKQCMETPDFKRKHWEFHISEKKKKKAQIRADKGEKHQLLTGSQQAKCSKLKIHSLEKCGVNKIILIEEACVCNQNERLYLYSSITATWNKGIKTFLKYNESEVWPVFHQKS